MGFAWSSFVGQEFLLNTCFDAGLAEHQIMSCDSMTPLTFEWAFAAATDDVMIFSAAGEGYSLRAAQALDAEFERRGIARNDKKDAVFWLEKLCCVSWSGVIVLKC